MHYSEGKQCTSGLHSNSPRPNDRQSITLLNSVPFKFTAITNIGSCWRLIDTAQSRELSVQVEIGLFVREVEIGLVERMCSKHRTVTHSLSQPRQRVNCCVFHVRLNRNAFLISNYKNKDIAPCHRVAAL